MVLAEAGHVEVVEAVVVVVADGSAHAPAHVADARLVRHVGERAVSVVVVEGALRFPAGLHHVNGQGVDEVDVEEAVVVVIKEGHAAAHGLDDIFFFGRGDVPEGDAGLLSYVREADFDGGDGDGQEKLRDE